jgi:peptidylprolyl isomerase
MIRADRLDTVKVHYIGTLTDGTVFDRSPEDRPLHFILGRDEVIPGFDEAVTGMFQGESKIVTVPCKKAYGEIRTDRIETVERSLLPAELIPEVGKRLEITRQDDSVFQVTIKAVSDTSVTLDANHPLAGCDLTFTIQLLEVKKPSPMESGGLFPTPPMTKH